MFSDETKSIVDKLGARSQAREKQKEMTQAQLEEWKQVILRLCANSDFQHFLKGMVEFSGLFTDEITRTDAVKLIEDRGRKQFYLKFVRPYLDKTIKSTIE